MATVKKTVKKVVKKEKKGWNKSSHEAPTVREMAVAMKRAQDIASGKKQGAIIIVEQFKEGRDKGITGLTYWHGVETDERAQVLAAVSGMPVEILMLMLTMQARHNHSK